MLTVTDIYAQLNKQAEKFGYSTLSEDERYFITRYKALHIRTGENPKKAPRAKQRTWTGVTVATSKRTRRHTAKARVWVDKSVATWVKPQSQPKEGVSSESLISSLPDIYKKK